MHFKDFKFKSRLAYAISRAGFTEPSPIQEKSIPLILEGRDMVGQAHTGTGKTGAFALPLLQKMTGKEGVETLVIVPTRELASQVADEFYKFSRNLKIRTATVYGGTSYRRQIEHIANAGVVVATPGRLLDLLSKSKIDIHPKYLVLDEADEMLNMGFLEDIRRIFEYFEDREQTLMFSATMPEEIKELAHTLLRNPEFIRVEKEAVTNNKIKQYYYVVDEHERDDAMVRLIETADPSKAIIFCRTKREVSRLADFLSSQGYKAEALHGDMEQYERQKTMKAFRRNECELLVATDVAARGLDVRGISHVFNYHIPFESESYVHRIGRTGRADKEGIAMMLVTPHELRELKRIQKDVGSELHPQAIPGAGRSLEARVKKILELINQAETSDISETLLGALTKKNNLRDISLKLISVLDDLMRKDVSIGKSKGEISKLLCEVDDTDVDSEKKKSSQRYKQRGMRQGNHDRRGQHRTQRGTERGQIPVPTITQTGGGSRIVARKLY